ncbi:rhodanese-related sulfurtransferase [Shimia isoporae]|uniref:Rhodanese-related sulfurtransferase n=1 Tax=Shimia isoporae TaxID=647720 RepID=A0A4R1NIZ7_9RHOB|nr:rhodanese-like domain-containing protein [Shimia isoporae]TCL08217.1 rhodanese-related sulfurtransferase [Shimia isoporae]
MMDRRGFLLAGWALIVPNAGWAENTLSASEAHVRLRSGELILIDLRTPEEWQETGVAEGAWPLDMREPEFGSWLLAAIERNPDKQVAIICRSGNRSGRMMSLLRDNGVEGVMDVSEGMLGGRRGPGWVPSGLPVVSAQTAFDAMPKDLVAK